MSADLQRDWPRIDANITNCLDFREINRPCDLPELTNRLPFDKYCERSRYFAPCGVDLRSKGVKVIPTNNPSGPRNRLTVWPHGSVLFLTSMR